MTTQPIQYLTLQQQAQLKYGERTVICYQIGSFFEIYGYDPDYCESELEKTDQLGKIWNTKIGYAVELSITLNCQLTSEDNKKPYSIRNPNKIGFPVISFDKCLNVLLQNDYTVLEFVQVKNGKQIDRVIKEVYSPVMDLNTISEIKVTNHVVCVYVEYQSSKNMDKHDNFLITTGISSIDIITGQTSVAECFSKSEDEIYAVQELYRLLISHYPKEILIYIDDVPADVTDSYVKFLEKNLELKRFNRINFQINKVSKEFKNINYQVEFMNKIHSKSISPDVVQCRKPNIIYELGLDKMKYGLMSYMLLVQHCYIHNPTIVSSLKAPNVKWIDETKHLVLTHNAAIQLDLLTDDIRNGKRVKKSEINSLFSILDENATMLGRRFMMNLLESPMVNIKDINTYYDTIEEMSIVTDDMPIYANLDKVLRQLPDLGRLHRKIELESITPKEIVSLMKTYKKIIDMYLFILGCPTPVLHTQLLSAEDITNYNLFTQKFSQILNLEALGDCSIMTSESDIKWLDFTKNPFNYGIFTELDEEYGKYVMYMEQLNQIVDHLNEFIKSSKGDKITFKTSKKKQGATKHDPTSTILATTNSKCKTVLAAKYDVNLCGKLTSVQNTSTEKIITSDKISYLCKNLDESKNYLRYTLYKIYNSIVLDMKNAFTFYKPLVYMISKIDVVHAYAKISSLYNYHRPTLEDNTDGSYLNCKDIRHPIVERIIDGEYILNDINLGKGDENRSNGIALFGLNSCGKTTLTKAVGLNVIMAQAGCFVPSILTLAPFTKIMTRLTGGDDLLKGLSSFATEMLELRTILRQADKNSLVLGDELCASTEISSGTAITISTIIQLTNANCAYMFSTHMHNLPKLDSIKDLNSTQLKILHLNTHYDEVKEILIYDRKLQDGPGSSVYGLLVAKYYQLPDEFIKKSYEVLNSIVGNNDKILSTKKSRYNSKLFVDTCSKCGANISLHSHHIKEQKYADDKGLINGMAKNSKHNLAVMCEACHTLLHKNKQDLRMVDTPEGKLLLEC